MITIYPMTINYSLGIKLLFIGLLLLIILRANFRWKLVKKKELSKLTFIKRSLLDTGLTIGLIISLVFVSWLLSIISF